MTLIDMVTQPSECAIVAWFYAIKQMINEGSHGVRQHKNCRQIPNKPLMPIQYMKRLFSDII